MTSLSIITALGREEYDYLYQAATTIYPIAQRWPIQWVLACDGIDASEVKSQLQNFPVQATVIDAPSSNHTSAGATRNRALAAVDGEWLLTLDSDDFYYPEKMTELIDTVTTSEFAWGAGLACDVDEKGNLIAAPPLSNLQEGWQNLDEYYQHWKNTNCWPWHPSATIVQTSLVRWIGGWQETGPLKDDEDVYLWATINRHTPGWYTKQTVMAYRKHQNNLTKQAHYSPYQSPFEEHWAKTGF